MNEAAAPVSSFPFQPGTFFAPMEGVTHPILRELIARRGGVGVVCTEFVRVTSNPLGRAILRKHVVRPSRGALSVQVMGNDIAQMADATALVTDAGADIVDINLGCPAPRAVRKGVGSAMLKDVRLLSRVLCEMRKRTHLPLSAKIRAGFDRTDGVLDLTRAVQDAGVDFLTVHPRRRVDFYDGVADWRIIALLVSELRIPVVGNGDIWYAEDALRIEKETGCAAVMLGRPVLRNPWIFQQIEALRSGAVPPHPDGESVILHLEELADALTAGYPERSALGMLKEQIRYLGRVLPEPQTFLRAALRAQEIGQLKQVAFEAFSGRKASELDLGARSSGRERSGSALVTSPEKPSGAAHTCGTPSGFGLVSAV